MITGSVVSVAVRNDVVAVANSLLVEDINWAPYSTMEERVFFSRQDGNQLPALRLAHISASPSWRRMYLTQPPVRKVRFHIPRNIAQPTEYPNGDFVDQETGITMGDIVEAVAQFSDEAGESMKRQRRFDEALISFGSTRVMFSESLRDGFEIFAQLTRAVEKTELRRLLRSFAPDQAYSGGELRFILASSMKNGEGLLCEWKKLKLLKRKQQED